MAEREPKILAPRGSCSPFPLLALGREVRLAEGAVGEQQVGRRELAGCVDAAGGARGGERETGARRGLMLKAGAGGGAGAEPRRQEGRRESCGPYMVWSNWSFFPFFFFVLASA